MRDIDEIRSGIRNRKEKKNRFKVLYSCIVLLFTCIIIIVTLLINDKLNFINISDILPFEKWFNNVEHPVNGAITYNLIKDNKYNNTSNTVSSLNDGIVIQISENKDKQSVAIQQDNGVSVEYSNLTGVNIKENERVLKGNAIGDYKDYIKIDVFKNGKTLTIDDAKG